jgi:large subunit ribosomal protein L6
MSRIGKLPVPLADNVEFSIGKDNVVTIKGEKGVSSLRIHPEIKVESRENEIQVIRANDSKEQKSLHGLYRSLINNMVEGVSKGYRKQLEIIGVGYRANYSNGVLELNLGFSHPIYFVPPDGVEIDVDTKTRKNNIINITGINKELVGQVAAKIRSLRKPEPYKGKGIRYLDEKIRRKAGKSAAK